jgi:hypothetical protein
MTSSKGRSRTRGRGMTGGSQAARRQGEARRGGERARGDPDAPSPARTARAQHGEASSSASPLCVRCSGATQRTWEEVGQKVAQD